MGLNIKPKIVIGLAAAVIGAAVGVFWLIAVDASVNGAEWPPNWRSWPAFATYPFTLLIGLNTVANVLVPVLNAASYGISAYALVWLYKRGHA